ncbi:monovalent cation/H(+) antiporter subunit G [Shewanella woodyi]|uniref:Monovalent cation/proton antiporter, MnhG/PhaG subunit n=1 Tax=Shewanella woodyi (strain ATCC 51908 / MS32) TaxID=392500 RepID=B1KG70_SHEWM|nr:monovalent cation/H(+) antiporter subunit G [Shewanella woodyi]ACA88207.1 monovalent cation/proton antiporter, MnhG/PhaG subunit [Shewanella woodyi ATCC 51908]
MNLFLEISSGLCLLIGCFLCFSGGIGILRFPDFYTRMHAVSITDTLGAGLVLLGLMLQSPDGLVLIKLILILLFTLFINPSASHALAKAALHNGLSPQEDKGTNKGGDKPSKL